MNLPFNLDDVGDVLHELRQIASRLHSKEGRAQSIRPTGLVNEAILKHMKSGEITWESRQKFFAIMNRTMRNVLIDRARRRLAQKRDIRRTHQIPLSTSLTKLPNFQIQF